MGLRIAIDIGQYPMGEPTPRSGVFVGRGDTPLGALMVATMQARRYYVSNDMKDTDKYEAAFALSEVDFTIYDSDGKAIFTPEDHYNCRLFIHERHKGA